MAVDPLVRTTREIKELPNYLHVPCVIRSRTIINRHSSVFQSSLFPAPEHRTLHQYLYDSLQKSQWIYIQLTSPTLALLQLAVLNISWRDLVMKPVVHVPCEHDFQRWSQEMNLYPWLVIFVDGKWIFPQMMPDLWYCRPTWILLLYDSIVRASPSILLVPLYREHQVMHLHHQLHIFFYMNLKWIMGREWRVTFNIGIILLDKVTLNKLDS